MNVFCRRVHAPSLLQRAIPEQLTTLAACCVGTAGLLMHHARSRDSLRGALLLLCLQLASSAALPSGQARVDVGVVCIEGHVSMRSCLLDGRCVFCDHMCHSTARLS